ncbi:ATP-binding protein [Pedobacter sp. MC2016-05]|uniref:hybrid sensor histidine kinase/response regulator transcription factor n=1 Tax=Pedobacter sp. MC2016-05 TaxID=2994474 RepID=UPI002245F4CB|nr:ATP-binding protein [Pedobacter sp. MC2016-05]MCX2475010.1 ATP-binding protein [Pedobacter sp. MC2016-05]
MNFPIVINLTLINNRPWLIILFCLFSSAKICAQNQVINITADSINTKNFEFNLNKSAWTFIPDSSQKWKNPEVKDSLSAKVNPLFNTKNIIGGWKGSGWFRLWIAVDSSLIGKTLGLRINHDGASEIYFDGVFKTRFGQIGTTATDTKAERAPFEVIPFEVTDNKPHLIAIKYANYNPIYPDFVGFQIWTGEYTEMQAINKKNKGLFEYMLMPIAVQFALGLLHLFFFLFYPKQKLNLYYFFYSVLFAATSWSVCMYSITSNPEIQKLSDPVFFVSSIIGKAISWVLLYKVGNLTIPKWKSIVVASITILYLIKYFIFPYHDGFDGSDIVFLIIMIDSLWRLFKTIRSQIPYAWIVGVGMIMILFFYFFVGADVFKLWQNYPLRCLTMAIGLLSFPFCYSIYLALDFARTNQNLSSRLIEVEQLSAKAMAQEKEKLELITQQAEKLEITVAARTFEVQQQADRLREMDAVKSRFFINLTHEFRTPLTLILGPAKQIMLDGKYLMITSYAKTILQNAERLLGLINQLLDLSKLESGQMQTKNQDTELVAIVKHNVLSFESLAHEKNIQLNFKSDWEKLWLSIDQEKLERILINLISNAVKFTKQDGKIIVNISEGEESDFEISIMDNGIGIPESKLPYIFDRFYQVDSSDSRAHEGTGIGLAITKELVNLMDGKLFISSIENEGTTIRIHFKTVTSENMDTDHFISSPEILSKVTNTNQPVSIQNDGLPLILVVEDNAEIRNYITQLLSHRYRIETAENGLVGIEKSKKSIPDLIITDLMMPQVDGYQVCATVKAEAKTSHIPVIILTAKADIDSRVAGFEQNADAYLSKPFDQRELLSIIQSLINTRKQLREAYGKNNLWLSNHTDLPSMEKVFLGKVKSTVALHLDDEQFSVEKLGVEIGLSRTQLHRKLIALINQSPGDLIRIIRMEHALKLLKNKVGTVAEIAYMVGYGNPQNFSTAFSKHFGFSPSEAQKN